jgi:predicted peptidase
MGERLQPRSFHYHDEQHLGYLLYLPPDYAANDGLDSSRTRWPLMLFLHGSGERGDDLDRIKAYGPPCLIADGHDFPCIVVVPQCPADERWSTPVLARLLDEIQSDFAVDRECIYLSGVSMGAYGTWALAIAEPTRFAAITPICGGGDAGQVCAIRNVPAWVFHGERDYIVPITESRKMVEALRACGGFAWFTPYPDLGHDCWTRTYNNPHVFTWLFAQRRGQPAVAPEEM